MRFPNPVVCLALGAFALPLAAQEPPVTESIPPIEILTSDPDIVAGVMGMFQDAEDQPSMALAEGQVFAITVSADRKAEVRQVQGSGWFDLRMRPGAVLAMFAQEAQRYQQMAQGMGGLALAPQGVPLETVAGIADAVFQFPDQLDALHLSIDQNPAGGQAMNLALRLDPRMDTWFGNLVASLRPNPTGVRTLPAESAPMSAAISVDLNALSPHLRPMIETLTGMSVQDPEGREKALLVSREFYDSMSGSAAIVTKPDGSMTWIGGLANAEKAAELMRSERYAEVEAMAAEALPDAELTLDVDAFTHRDVSVMSKTVDTGESMPGGGKMTSYYAIIGDSLIIQQFGERTDGMKSMIDAVLDGKLERRELGDDVLMTADMRVAEFISEMAAAQGGPVAPEDLEEMPERARVKIRKQGTGLVIEVKTE